MRPRRNVFDPRGTPFVSSPSHPSLSVFPFLLSPPCLSLSVFTAPSLVVLLPSAEVLCPSVFPTLSFSFPFHATSVLSFSNPVPSFQPGYNQSVRVVRVVRNNPPPTLLWHPVARQVTGLTTIAKMRL